ncbi:Uncharacterized conserved protein, DUF427 family [Modestobacter sp. DSM 44400]|uniref:DUF427 domain-containing protein n=1 Tax=Modestobacter sp. DSM 44400 TaxID=1550230 RepID=UPI00089A1B8A|nr:DUF427 domain-containing protein [Modestobacter sp. DSM 44400]SDY04591.1 Uncharacterized conserved protein, DUF427 family [Modestobacter sp. DSM 44400]
MSHPEAPAASIEVLWRPGCPYCARLRRGLQRAGVPTVERNIWADPAAASRVRAATGGDETVPTVLVGGRALVNPSVRDVVAAVRAAYPEDAERVLGSATEPPSASATGRTAAGWTLAAAALWILVAAWRPTTTWHLAPVLIAAAAPWLVGQDLRAGDRRAGRRLAAAAVAGFLTAATITAGLARVGLLRGPTVLGPLHPWAESLVLAAAAAALAAAPGLARALRAPAARSAWMGEHLLARSDDVVMVEGNAYFPPSAIQPGVLTPTSTRTVCPWKGVAGYYTVNAGGVEHPDAAWSYRHPSPLARRVKDRVAFWGDVDVRAEPHSTANGDGTVGAAGQPRSDRP